MERPSNRAHKGEYMRHDHLDEKDSRALPGPMLKRGATMLSIAAIIFAHILYVIAITPNMHAYVILIEFIPFIICGVVGIIQASNNVS